MVVMTLDLDLDLDLDLGLGLNLATNQYTVISNVCERSRDPSSLRSVGMTAKVACRDDKLKCSVGMTV